MGERNGGLCVEYFQRCSTRFWIFFVQSGMSNLVFPTALTTCTTSMRCISRPLAPSSFALHEMFVVLLLSMRELPYEEYVLSFEELNQLNEKDRSVYKTYWEMLYDFRIYAKVFGMRGQGVGQKTSSYFFRNFDLAHVKVARHKGLNMT